MPDTEFLAYDAVRQKYHKICGEWAVLEAEYIDAVALIEERHSHIQRLQEQALGLARWLDKHPQSCHVGWEELFMRRLEWEKIRKCAACGRVRRWYMMRWGREDEKFAGQYICKDDIACPGQPNPTFPPVKEK